MLDGMSVLVPPVKHLEEILRSLREGREERQALQRRRRIRPAVRVRIRRQRIQPLAWVRRREIKGELRQRRHAGECVLPKLRVLQLDAREPELLDRVERHDVLQTGYDGVDEVEVVRGVYVCHGRR